MLVSFPLIKSVHSVDGPSPSSSSSSPSPIHYTANFICIVLSDCLSFFTIIALFAVIDGHLFSFAYACVCEALDSL